MRPIVCVGIVVVLFWFRFPLWVRHVAEIRRAEIIQRHEELAAIGKLDIPAEGISAVSFLSGRHGGRPRLVKFYDGDGRVALKVGKVCAIKTGMGSTWIFHSRTNIRAKSAAERP